ncbi:MAG: hypothetical protein KAU29_01310, partial [Gammaproteobacteria bacterium]|nr:hypothetical protein [Gammaproteobacteria bacterium]
IASLVLDTSSNNLDTEHNENNTVSASVEDIVQNILEGYDDLSNEDEEQDYLEITDPDEHIYNSAISDLSTMVEDIKYDANLYPDPSGEEGHEDIMARIESAWAKLIEVWPMVQKQPHVVAKIEELWNTLKETNNNTIEIPSEFDRLFDTTNNSTFDSKTGSDLHRSIMDDNVVNIDTLFNEKEQESTPNTNTLFDSNVHTESNVLYDDELSELVLSILGENGESGESTFQETSETIRHTLIEDELKSNQSDNEQAGAKTSTTFVDDKLGDLVSNILANNSNRFSENPSEINDETNSNTLDIDVSDEVDAILRKYAIDEEITPDVITESELDEPEISTPDETDTADSLLQELLDRENDSSNGNKAENTQPDLPSISSENMSSLAAPSTSEKLKTVSQSTPGPPAKSESLVKTSATSSTSLNKTVVNTALAADTPTSGWKWALASLV